MGLNKLWCGLLGHNLQSSVGSVSSGVFLKTFQNEVCSTRSVCSGPSLNGSCIATSRCDPNRGQRGGQDAAAHPCSDPKRGQRRKRCCSSSFSTSLSAPTVAGDLHGSLDSGRCVLRPSPMTCGASSSVLRSSSGRVSSPAVASGCGAVGCSASALRARDVLGSFLSREQ